jgi:Fusaric acid resistance protein-like
MLWAIFLLMRNVCQRSSPRLRSTDGRLLIIQDRPNEAEHPMKSTETNIPGHEAASEADRRVRRSSTAARVMGWIEQIDPGRHRRIKGLRLVAAYGIAVLLGAIPAISHRLAHGALLSFLAGGFALWACVSEGRATRAESSRDLAILSVAAAVGAVMMIRLAPALRGVDRPGPELTLALGAFLVGYLKRFGILGAGVGSQIYIGQLLAYNARLTTGDLWMVGAAGLIAAFASIAPRLFSDLVERPALASRITSAAVAGPADETPGLFMGLQAAVAAVVIVVLNDAIGLEESAWAITACTYVIANSRAATMERVRRRIFGTAVGVPLGLACLPVALHAPVLIWIAAAVAMVIYSMALPERYDIACAAYAFSLIVTMAATGEDSLVVLSARAWETLIGGAVGLVAAMLVVPPKTAARVAD